MPTKAPKTEKDKAPYCIKHDNDRHHTIKEVSDQRQTERRRWCGVNTRAGALRTFWENHEKSRSRKLGDNRSCEIDEEQSQLKRKGSGLMKDMKVEGRGEWDLGLRRVKSVAKGFGRNGLSDQRAEENKGWGITKEIYNRENRRKELPETIVMARVGSYEKEVTKASIHGPMRKALTNFNIRPYLKDLIKTDIEVKFWL